MLAFNLVLEQQGLFYIPRRVICQAAKIKLILRIQQFNSRRARTMNFDEAERGSCAKETVKNPSPIHVRDTAIWLMTAPSSLNNSPSRQ